MFHSQPLSRQEQLDLCAKAQAGDLVARNHLVTSNMRMVVAQAKQAQHFSRYSELEDLTGEGVFGLMRAIEKFDASRGVAFITYASHWVGHYVREAAYRDRGLRKSDVNRGAIIGRDYRQAIKDGIHPEDAIDQISAQRHMKRKTIVDLLEIISRPHHASLDAPVHEDGGTTLGDLMSDETAVSSDEKLVRARRLDAVSAIIARFRRDLDERQLYIFDNRVLIDEDDAITLKEIGDRYGLSRERVRQIQVELADAIKGVISRSVLLRPDPVPYSKTPQYDKERWEKLKAAGKCTCGKKARPGLATCGTCRQSPAQQKLYRERRRKLGVCMTHATRPAVAGTTRCKQCHAHRRAYQKRVRDERRAAGQCQNCATPTEGAWCSACKERYKKPSVRLSA